MAAEAQVLLADVGRQAAFGVIQGNALAVRLPNQQLAGQGFQCAGDGRATGQGGGDKVAGARAVLEVGTGAGVSGLCLLDGMARDGVLTTIDVESELLGYARRNFAAAGLSSHRTRLIAGRALDVLPRMAARGYDMVVLDGDLDETTPCVLSAPAAPSPSCTPCGTTRSPTPHAATHAPSSLARSSTTCETPMNSCPPSCPSETAWQSQSSADGAFACHLGTLCSARKPSVPHANPLFHTWASPPTLRSTGSRAEQRSQAPNSRPRGSRTPQAPQ